MDESQRDLVRVIFTAASLALCAMSVYSLVEYKLGVGGLPFLVGMGALQPAIAIPLIWAFRPSHS